MQGSAFSVFLNVVLGVLLVGGVVFVYFFGNFGGIGVKELNSEYLLKKELSFSDLPIEQQHKYIDISRFKSQSKTMGLDKVVYDKKNPFVADAEGFRDVIASLHDKIIFLEKENISLLANKDELLKIVSDDKHRDTTEQKELLLTNLEKINEAEKQHYKNISELTKKINDLQRENIELSVQINQKDESLKDASIKLKKETKAQGNLLIKREKELEKIYETKLLSVENRSSSKEKQIEDLKDMLKSEQATRLLKVEKKDQQIVQLKNKINEMLLDKNSILTKNSQAVMSLEREHSKKLKEINDMVKSGSNEKEIIKKEYQKLLKRVEQKHSEQLESRVSNLQKLEQELVKERQNSKLLDSKIQSIAQKNRAEVDSLAKKIDSLNTEITTLKSSEKKVKSELKRDGLEITLAREKILQLKEKIASLESHSKAINDEVDKQVKINEKKHNENYKILNKRVALLELEIDSKEDLNKEELLAINIQKTKIADRLDSVIDENMANKKTIQTLKDDIHKIKKKRDRTQLDEYEKFIAVKKSFDKLKLNMDSDKKKDESTIKNLRAKIASQDIEFKQMKKSSKKLGDYIREITYLKKIIRELESTKKLVKAGDKLQLLDKVECEDMVSGNFKISPTCKAKVDEFLTQFDEAHYFEVIPIMGAGGFASLNKVQRDRRLGIPDSEIKRLTRLANIGLARDRAKEGGWLIRDKFGDDVKISYTVYSIESKDKRGFVIRAYR